MKSIFTIFLFIGIINSASSQEMKSLADYSGYIPSSISNIYTDGVFFDEFGNNVDINLLKLSDFNRITTSVTVIDNEDKIGGFGVTYNKGVYKVIYSFEAYVEVFDNLKNKHRIGASIEVISNIKTRKKKLDLSSLFNLAIAAERNKVSGSISMTAKGFNTDTIYGLFNINASIDKASVQNVLKNAGIMISKFTDKTITLKPVILGYESKRGTE